MRKRWLTLGAYLLLAGGMAAVMLEDGKQDTAGKESEAVWSGMSNAPGISVDATETVMETVRSGQGKRDVFVHIQYVCGEEIRQLNAMPVDQILSLKKEHPNATVTLDESGRVHMLENVEDLAPKCKDNAYFGMDKNGNLTLFEGVPEQDRVIRTFFQLDVQHMKSSLPSDAVNQLYSGIKVSDLADYNSVLSTFSDYASEQAEPASSKASNK